MLSTDLPAACQDQAIDYELHSAGSALQQGPCLGQQQACKSGTKGLVGVGFGGEGGAGGFLGIAFYGQAGHAV